MATHKKGGSTEVAPETADREVTGPRSLARLLGLFDVLSLMPNGQLAGLRACELIVLRASGGERPWSLGLPGVSFRPVLPASPRAGSVVQGLKRPP
jgi:hypothetical protein